MSERMVTFKIGGAVSKGEVVVEVTVCSDNNEDFRFAVFAYNKTVEELRAIGYRVATDPERKQV